MSFFVYILIALGTFILMEGFSWCLHRYVMHGFLWNLHKDHHQKGPGFFEKNDYFFLIFAIPSWLFIMMGVIIIHQRIKWFTRTNNTYIRTVRWAHKMHHKHLDSQNGESFGMLWVSKKYWNKVRADLKRNRK